MPRTVLIVPAGADPLDYLDEAQATGASEIILGVPALWSALIPEADLPVVHVEPDPPTPPVAEFEPDPVAILTARLAAQEARVDALLLGGLVDAAEGLDGVLGDDLGSLPDAGGTLDDLLLPKGP